MYSMSSKSWLFTLQGAALAACAAGPTASATATARAPADVAAVLRTQTQALLDAVSSGDPTVWDRYLDPGVMYLAESGEIEDKKQLLAEVKPLPTGISGKIEIGRFEARVHGDTAVVFHVDEEYERYFGHAIHAQYLNTATWRLGPTGWKLIATQVLASLIDPPAITLPADQLDDYLGSFQLTPEVHYTIRRDGDHLVGQRTGRPAQPLLVEARDVFFVAGQPRSRKIFLRDSRGRVTGFADRREARDIPWTKEPATP